MILGDMMFELILRLRRPEMSISLDRPVAKQLLNEALQFIYPFAKQMDRSVYVRSNAFGSTAALTLPPHHLQTVAVTVPSAASYSARIANHREYIPMNINTYVKGTTNDPLATMQSTTVAFTPAVAGTQYYVWTFGYIDDETTNITALGDATKPALIPWMAEELVILKAMELARIRHNMAPLPGPSETDKRMQIVQQAYQVMKPRRNPLSLFEQETPVQPPTIPGKTA